MKSRIAVAGVGNCASVFVQGLEYYSTGGTEGLWHPRVAGMRASDLKVVAAFDVDPRKVGLDLHKAIFAAPNVARRYVEPKSSRVKVSAGISAADAAPHLRSSRLETADRAEVARQLEAADADILVNLISSGSDASSEGYALAALEAGCAFVNCAPSLLLRRKSLVAKFAKSKLPLVGDDLMSQFGGTVFHKGLLNLMVNRGVKISKSYQLDVGGGSETLNTTDEGIKMAKRGVKTASVAAEVPYKFETIAGTTDFVDYLGNDRTSYFWAEGSGFLGSPATVDVYLRTSDGANAGNILLDVLRATRRAASTRRLAKVNEICAYGFKSPLKPVHFEEAYRKFVAAFVK
ncbi:MAG: inositol-3-phosphate synthase [Nitrososphaerales archaeon]|nr:inositol-3-phosphate synthase [Nitrososphaerales archaeon]